MDGAPDYRPGDLIAAISNSHKYPVKKGQVFLCEGLRPPPQGLRVWGVYIQGLVGLPKNDGALRALAFRKVDPLPPAFFTGAVDVGLSTDAPVRENV